MISVVISTRDKNQSFIDEVKKSSGVKNIEFLVYENKGEMSLTEVYNKGLEESTNDVVLFMHDDIIIKTKNWGEKLLRIFKDNHHGIIGVAGTKKLNDNGIWWSNKESMYGIVYHTDGKFTWVNNYSKKFTNKVKDVVVVDGVFMACKKSRIKTNFNESYKGFHFYDISFSYENYLKGVGIGVMFDIEIIHKSIGLVNDKWEKNRLQFIENQKSTLPNKVDIDFYFKNPDIRIKNQKKLAVIIPTKNNTENLLFPCIDSILLNTKYENYTIYIADTGSDKAELDNTKKYIENTNNSYGKNRIRLTEYDYYNFAKINNDMIKNKIDSDTELILFCNNDIEMLNDAISIMVNTHENTKNVGTVGCRLHYDDGSIQHMGISIEKIKETQIILTHKFINYDFENIEDAVSDIYTHGNTAAFMLISKKLFLDVGCFNEIYTECFEDVELNLNCLLKRKVNVTTSKAACYHYESQTRKRENENLDLQIIMKFINSHDEIKNMITSI